MTTQSGGASATRYGWAERGRSPGTRSGSRAAERPSTSPAADAAGLRGQLGEIRHAGYAVSHDELSANVHGLSVPVKARGLVVASIGVVLPSVRAAQLLEFAPVMKKAATAIAQGLGRAG